MEEQVPTIKATRAFQAREVVRLGEQERPELSRDSDSLAVEEPLEINLSYPAKGAEEAWESKPISITMRTPGISATEDIDLALGFLYTEGIIRSLEEVKSADYQLMDCSSEQSRQNRIVVQLSEKPDTGKLQRHFYTSSSCGVCGKASLEAVSSGLSITPAPENVKFGEQLIHTLGDALRQAQFTFSETGGLHAAGVFSGDGTLKLLREDVGRHNALDKVIGAALQQGALPLHNSIVMVSGRASFELIQKALVAGFPALAAVGAPSTLAVDLASKYGMTLIGFLRRKRFNIYSGTGRVVPV